MSRPLYIVTAARHVELDGPALRVEIEGQTASRVPIRQIDRVVSRFGAEWSTAALLACLTAGVPVVFLAGDGSAAGHCLPARQRASTLAKRLDSLERRHDGMTVFANWEASEQRWAVLALIGRPGSSPVPDLRPERLHMVLLTEIGASLEWARGALRAFEGLLTAHLSALLLAAGLPHHHTAPAPIGRLDLFGACFAAARWDLFPALRAAAEHRQAHPRAWRNGTERAERIARRYEAVAPRIAAMQSRRLRRLDQWLWEIEA